MEGKGIGWRPRRPNVAQLFQQQRPWHGLFHLEEQLSAGSAFFCGGSQVRRSWHGDGQLSVMRMDGGYYLISGDLFSSSLKNHSIRHNLDLRETIGFGLDGVYRLF
jgi:hypothetical protein